jgi:Fe-S cluster biogenesis protein NfuA
MAIETKDILVRTLPTPNPFALKFVVNQPLKSEGKATFHSLAECQDLPLIRDLFMIEGVRQVHVFQNTVSVTHVGEFTDTELAEKVESVIRTRLPIHNPEFGEAVKPLKPHKEHSDPILAQIEEILDRTIRPGLQADGGDVEVVDFSNNELQIVYQGACGGCPSSMMGTLDAIQGILQHELGNPDIQVTPI